MTDHRTTGTSWTMDLPIKKSSTCHCALRLGTALVKELPLKRESAEIFVRPRGRAMGGPNCKYEVDWASIGSLRWTSPQFRTFMRIHVGCELSFEFPQATPMIATLNVHFSRVSDLERPDYLVTSPSVPIEGYRDSFGNWCNRLVAPPGHFSLGTDAVVRDSGMPDPVDLNALQHQVQRLPVDVVLFLLGSRYCETDRLSDKAWHLFGHTPLGWPRVQAICDFVHNHITFGYEHSRATRTAAETYEERRGVCRDYAHLAVTFCRCLNIPARYCTGYITDVGVPPPYAPMDFAAWIEIYLGGHWHTFDPRNNAPRIGRVLIAHGRDAADVPLTHNFGPGTLSGFRVWAEEVLEQ